MASKEIQAFLDALRDKPKKSESGSIEEQRAGMDKFMSYQTIPDNVLIDDFTLAHQPARKYFTDGVREDATVLYLHGGGYNVGSLDSHHSFHGPSRRCVQNLGQRAGLLPRARTTLSCGTR